MKYRKRPIEIEAFQYGPDDYPHWFRAAIDRGDVTLDLLFCEIKTLEGSIRCDAGGYVIQGVNGELYPCREDIFLKTYDPVK